MTTKFDTYKLPVYWANYLINGDETGLQGNEINLINDRTADMGRCVSVSEETEFGQYAGIGCDLATYTFGRELKILTLLDFDTCKQIIDRTPKGENAILCPHYSINIASQYEDGEQLDWDLNDLEDMLGHTLTVSDYDDLIVELPNGGEEEEE